MAYVLPTPADLKARLPAFASVPDETVQLYLDEAGGRVDQTWTERDYRPAIMFLAAHLMVGEGIGTGAEAEAAAAGAGDFQQLTSGSLTLRRFDRSTATQADVMGSTVYGKRYAELRRTNFTGPMVV